MSKETIWSSEKKNSSATPNIADGRTFLIRVQINQIESIDKTESLVANNNKELVLWKD